MPRYAQPATRNPRRGAVAAAVAVLALGAAVVGRASAPSTLVAKPPIDRATQSRTPTGAATAVAAWLGFNDSREELLNPQHRRATVERFASMSARERLGEELDDAARRLRADLAGPPATVRGAPLGYRIVAFSPARSLVLAWEVVLRGGLDLAPAALVAESRITLVWEGGWKVDRVEVKAYPLSAWSADDLATADEHFGSFRHVP